MSADRRTAAEGYLSANEYAHDAWKHFDDNWLLTEQPDDLDGWYRYLLINGLHALVTELRAHRLGEDRSEQSEH